MKTRFVRSARAVSGARGSAACFSTGSDSPVSGASLARSSAAAMSRASAGTDWPASSTTTSPGTRACASISSDSPSRITVARGTSSRRSAAIAPRARYSVVKPRAALMTRTATIASASTGSPITQATSAAATRRRTTTLRNWSARIFQAETGRAARSALRPCRSRRACASASEIPSGEDPRRLSTSSAGRACQGADSASSVIGAPPTAARAPRGRSSPARPRWWRPARARGSGSGPAPAICGRSSTSALVRRMASTSASHVARGAARGSRSRSGRVRSSSHHLRARRAGRSGARRTATSCRSSTSTPPGAARHHGTEVRGRAPRRRSSPPPSSAMRCTRKPLRGRAAARGARSAIPAPPPRRSSGASPSRTAPASVLCTSPGRHRLERHRARPAPRRPAAASSGVDASALLEHREPVAGEQAVHLLRARASRLSAAERPPRRSPPPRRGARPRKLVRRLRRAARATRRSAPPAPARSPRPPGRRRRGARAPPPAAPPARPPTA